MLQVGSVDFDRQGIADHANNLASTIQLNLKRSLEAIGVVGPAVLTAALAAGSWQHSWVCLASAGITSTTTA